MHKHGGLGVHLPSDAIHLAFRHEMDKATDRLIDETMEHCDGQWRNCRSRRRRADPNIV